ncbi:hypothetical protein IGS68_22570 [Skermanella sp. TT6]|uniref:Uncharacterized protein n=1 Tax=Skermanella cutis TaxID=2775420 RepID=A0ABX7B357_9PROT|nr:hypothetical protein [Skermanella sp. TT6]QQP88769.1 hypothetical protein IGS68_22570 [Skermanella sp. TT6]
MADEIGADTTIQIWTDRVSDADELADDAGACPLVLVEWEDSAQPVSSWQWITAYKEPDIVTCASVGWLIHDGADVKALAPNLGHSDEQRAVQVSGVIRIPTRCVTRIVSLTEMAAPTSSSSPASSSVSDALLPDRQAAE